MNRCADCATWKHSAARGSAAPGSPALHSASGMLAVGRASGLRGQIDAGVGGRLALVGRRLRACGELRCVQRARQLVDRL